MKLALVIALGSLLVAGGATAKGGPAPLVFVLAGQSNMVGTGQPAPKSVPTRRVLELQPWTGKWVPAVEPLGRWTQDVGTPFGVGPGMSFALNVARKTGAQVRLVMCAQDGSSISSWSSGGGGEFMSMCQRQIAKTAGTFAGAIFFQGESDTSSAETAASWARLFAGFVSSVRDDVHNPRLPIVFAQLGATPAIDAPPPAWNVVKAQQASVRLPRVAMITTDDLPQLGEHFTTGAYQVIGARFARAWLKMR